MASIAVQPGQKYAIVVLPRCPTASGLQELTELGSGLWATIGLPFPVPDPWIEWLGTLRVKELNDADLCLVTVKCSTKLEELNNENRQLSNRVLHLYTGVLIAGSLENQRPFRFTGANVGGQLEIRETQNLDRVFRTRGTPRERIDEARLAQAGEIAQALVELSERGGFKRFWRAHHAFYAAIHENEVGDRLHQFVRCIEGFILPKIGSTRSQFVSRCELFIGSARHELTGDLFGIRSRVEHLHAPWAKIDGQDEREERITVFRRGVEAEAIARYCLNTFLSNRTLWPHFENDEALGAFWQKPPAERRKLWGDPLDLDAVSEPFRSEFLRDEDLGLATRGTEGGQSADSEDQEIGGSHVNHGP